MPTGRLTSLYAMFAGWEPGPNGPVGREAGARLLAERLLPHRTCARERLRPTGSRGRAVAWPMRDQNKKGPREGAGTGEVRIGFCEGGCEGTNWAGGHA